MVRFYHRTGTAGERRRGEFCAGLALRGELLTASFGYRDRDAYLASMRLDEVLATLRPVEG